jgi:hypothetical protein
VLIYMQYYAMVGNWLKQYYVRIFGHLMYVCALNACHVHRKLGGNKKWLMFLIELAEKQIQKYSTPCSAVRVWRPSELPRPSQI